MIRFASIRRTAVRSFLIMCVSGVPSPIFAEGESFCAFRVEVKTPAGAPLEKQVYAQAVTGKEGSAKLCDAPFEPVDVLVGFDICGSVLVRNLSPTWPETRNVSVTYADAPCDHFGVSQTCRMLIRILDEAGKPVEGALFSGTPYGSEGQSTSDRYGRIFRTMLRQQKIEGFVAKEGRQPARVSSICASDAELKVSLRPAR